MKNKYEDILYLPYFGTKTRKPMSMTDRGAQFSPFAALTGYEAAIQETGRLTDSQVHLEEYSTSQIDEKLSLLWQYQNQHPHITVVYFLPDGHKSGGAYITKTESVKKVDPYGQQLLLQDETGIPFQQIYALSGAVFGKIEAYQYGIQEETE